MGPEVVNKNKDSVFNGPYAGRDLYITMYQDSEREFVVTHKANIKPVSYFTGREAELQDLRRMAEEGRKSVLVSGMGGIGKTHICRKLFEEYLNKHAEDGNEPFRHIGYIEYNGDMGSSLQNGLKYKRQESPEQNQEAAWRELEYLAADGKLLLFVDNVDRPVKVDSGLQRLKEIPGAIVLTSRQISFGDEFEPYRIGFLGMQQCIEIYEKIRFRDSGKKIKPEEVFDLEYVIKTLAGRHTITVELLAHLARTKLWTVKKLHEELDEKGFCLEFYKDGELVNIQKSYEILYDLSGLTEAEQNILEAFSVFPYIPLAVETCNEWLLADAGVSEDDDILMRLYQKGWLQFDMEQEGYAMHPVFGQFIYEKCRPVVERHFGLLEACRRCLKISVNGSVLAYQKFIPYAETIAEKLNMGEGEKQVDFVRVTARLLYDMAEYKRAEKILQRYVGIFAAGENHLVAICLNNDLAMVYERQGEYLKAKKLYEKSLKIYESEQVETPLIKAILCGNLGLIYKKLGEYAIAKELYEVSLQIFESEQGEYCLYTAGLYNKLAIIYENQGEDVKAKELFEKSLELNKDIGEKNYLDIAISYNGLAAFYLKQREFAKAKKICEESLQIRAQIYGENHPTTAVGYNELGRVYEMQCEYELAFFCYLKAYKICKLKLGSEHLDTQNVYKNIEIIYSNWNPEGDFKLWLEGYMKGNDMSMKLNDICSRYGIAETGNLEEIKAELKRIL